MTRIRLIEERKSRQWSQQEVADLVGTTQRNVSRWERGLTTPGPYFRARLSELFAKSLQELGLVEAHPSFSPLGEREVRISKHAVSSSEGLALWTVPYARNPHFTGRDALLEQLDQYLFVESQSEPTTTHRVALTQPQAIKGLGGIGKTQIAIEYAYRALETRRYTHILWVNAASEETIISSLMELAELLPDITSKGETNQRKLVASIKRWFEKVQQCWLLIFDNADTITYIQEYLPQCGNGSILLTTRADAVGSLASSLEVEKMGFTEGTHFLLRRARRFEDATDEVINEVGNIVIALDYFPLALDQAGAYIEETKCSFADYLQLYQSHRNALLARRGTQITGYPDSVATTWSLSFQKVEQANPAASELLRLCAFLAPDHIPEELLREGRSFWPPFLQHAVTDLFTWNQMLKELFTFSLMKRLTEHNCLSLHRLVQIVQRETMDWEEQRQWIERVVCAVNKVFPHDPKEDVTSWPQCLRYVEQVQACATLIQHYNCLRPEAANLLHRAAIYLQEHALYDQASALYHQALDIHERILQPDHSDGIRILYHLGTLARLQGKRTEAETFFQKALQLFQQVPVSAPEHLLQTVKAQTLTALGNLSIDQGNYSEAEEWFLQAVNIQMQQGASEQQPLASSLNGLGNAYVSQGRYREAASAYQRSLQAWECRWGPDHPQVAVTLSNLAIAYYEEGKYDQAKPLLMRAVKIQEKVFGPEHPQLASSLTILGSLCAAQRRDKDAEMLHLRALQIWERSLGPDHLQVAYACTSLGKVYRVQRNYTAAEHILQRALMIRENAFASGHILLVFPLTALGGVYRDQKSYEKAERCLQRALSIGKATVGLEHPDLIDPLTEQGSLYRDQERFDKAWQPLEQALKLCEQHLGAGHPKIMPSLNALAEYYCLQNNYRDAQPLYLRALQIGKQTQASGHPEMIAPFQGLAMISQEQGDFAEAEALYLQALKLCEDFLEPHDPATANTLNGFATLREGQGNLQEAFLLYQRTLAIYECIYDSSHPKTIETQKRLCAIRVVLKQAEERA